ncbi:MAG: DUF4012 domain-containing protein [Patescibacteria group bacterium]
MKKPTRNFVSNKDIFKHASRKRRKKTLWYCLSAVALLLIIIGGLIAAYWQPAKEVMAYGTAGKDGFIEAQELLLSQDFSAAETELHGAIEDFQSAQKTFSKFLWLKYLPVLGTQIKAIDNLLSVGVATGQSISEVSVVAASIVEPLKQDEEISLATLSEEQTHQLLEDIYNSKPKLEAAKVSIDRAVSFVDQIPDRGLIKKISEIIDPLKDQVPRLQTGLDQAISISQMLPLVVGYPEMKTYLFLLENNAELAPSGGFIGTYGILKISDGDIISFETDNVYNLDEPAEEWLDVDAPWPVARYNAAPKLFLRGASWSPDFPTTGQSAQWFYREERGPEKNIDGTIAITPTFIQSLLTLTGEITVDGLTFTTENFTDVLQDQVSRGFLREGIPLSERKEIIGVLSDKILDSVLSLPKSRWPELWKIISQNIKEKHILVYANDDYVQSMILKENWGGEIQQVNHDYLAVIDANLASLKTDPVVDRHIDYQLQRDGKNIIADVSITYTNTGTITWKTTRYRTYTRVFVPEGSTLLVSEGTMVDCKNGEKGGVETLTEHGKTSFGAFICIEPGETKTLHYKYHLPGRIYDQLSEGNYSVLVQKQAGAANHSTSFSINLEKRILDVEGLDIEPTITDTTVSFSPVLSEDRTVNISFE